MSEHHWCDAGIFPENMFFHIHIHISISISYQYQVFGGSCDVFFVIIKVLAGFGLYVMPGHLRSSLALNSKYENVEPKFFPFLTVYPKINQIELFWTIFKVNCTVCVKKKHFVWCWDIKVVLGPFGTGEAGRQLNDVLKVFIHLLYQLGNQ